MPIFEVKRHSTEFPWTYERLDQRQRLIAEQVAQGGEGKFLLSELAPVITVGRRTPVADFENSKIEILKVDRGGLATYHGPGQWLLFPVESLRTLTGDARGVRKIITKLLQVAKSVAQARGVQAEIREGSKLGVWTPRGKFAAVGIQIKNGVVMHGLSLNGFETSQSFQGLRPCGLDLPVDYLLSGPGDFEALGAEIQTAVIRNF